MNAAHGADLAPYTSFRVPARAGRLVPLENLAQLEDIAFSPRRDLVLGGGSNVLLVADVPGTVYHNRFRGRQVGERDGTRRRVSVAAGEPWHSFVRWTLDQGLSGLENLSLIPGLVGAAPIQNIGAYGVELAEWVQCVEVWDWHARRRRSLTVDECAFAYRDSRFKSGEPDRYLVTGLVLALEEHFQPRLGYAGVREALEAEGITVPTPRDVSDAIVRLRRSKLPDPAEIGNAGSFFKNPVLDATAAEDFARRAPDAPLHPFPDGRYKTSAAWLIERCGWKGFRQGGAGVSDRHALVLVNHGAATGRELAALAKRIRNDVEHTFGVRLEPEPRIIDDTTFSP